MASRPDSFGETGLPRGVSGAADPHFASVARLFGALFPGRRMGGGALSVYVQGQPVVDIWTGWADRRGTRRWTADTAPMAFSATKGVASTVIHRLVDRGLLSYDVPVAEYWPAFGVNGKAAITLRDIMRHSAGLSHLRGLTRAEMLDHERMEHRLAAARVDGFAGRSAYHALTYGWLVAAVARSVTGSGMRELIRTELAAPLGVDGLHLGRPPAAAPTTAAEILLPQRAGANRIFDTVAPRVAAIRLSKMFAALYVPGIRSALQGDAEFLDAEIPSANGVLTARGLARMYGAIANGGSVDGVRLLSPERVRELSSGRRSYRPDGNVGVPMNFHLGYHGSPLPGVLPGFGHAGMGGSIGWADPGTGSSFAFVHNRLVTPMVFDQSTFLGMALLLRRAVAGVRRNGVRPIHHFGSPYAQTADDQRSG